MLSIHSFFSHFYNNIPNGYMFFAQVACLIYPIYLVDRIYTSQVITNLKSHKEKHDSETLSAEKIATNSYIEFYRTQLLDIIETGTNPEEQSLIPKYNENVSTLFYDPPTLEQELAIDNNELEREWSQRFLLEHTPMGNVVMYYDAYKQAFSYASDEHIPYTLLNAIAMKYVIQYSCLDFFIDTTILPNGYKSPLTLVEEEIERKKREKKQEKQKAMGIDMTDGPFLKPKTKSKPTALSTESSKKSSSSDVSGNPMTDEIIYKNVFRHIGKYETNNLLQSCNESSSSTLSSKKNSKHVPQLPKFTAPCMNPILPSSYLDYKRAIHPPSPNESSDSESDVQTLEQTLEQTN